MDKKDVTENEDLQAVIDEFIEKLKDETPGTKEYAAMVSQLSGLYRIKETHTNIETKKLDALNKQDKTALECENLEQEKKHKAAEAEYRTQEFQDKHAESEANAKLKDAEARIKEKEANSKIPVKPETLALIGGNLAGIVAILGYERFNIITSKALGFVKTLK